MRVAAIIPARYGATRLPGKLLKEAAGKPVVQHTYERVREALGAAGMVVVATDDARIAGAAERFGARVVMTRADHETGTSRAAEAAAALEADIIVNVQGDEPEIAPAAIRRLIDIQARRQPFAATLAAPFAIAKGPGSPDDPAAVKALLGEEIEDDLFEARWFARQIGVAARAPDGGAASPGAFSLHIGAYAFTPRSIAAFAAMTKGVFEVTERLEQLRILEAGERMLIGRISSAAPGVDTAEDLEAFRARMSSC